jgi:hypothetical protein
MLIYLILPLLQPTVSSAVSSQAKFFGFSRMLYMFFLYDD